MSRPVVGVVIATHNSARWIAETLESISGQTHLPDKIVFVDDRSTDGTSEVVTNWFSSTQRPGIVVEWLHTTSVNPDPRTRIAQNFTQGVRALASADYVALADHDDVWLPHRLESQIDLMQESGSIYLASNGFIKDGTETLFDAFHIPEEIEDLNATQLLRHVLRRSVATGGASMIRPPALLDSGTFVPPRGWLHDRWWSLVAATQGLLQVSRKPVIDYRISPDQSVGLDRGRQGLQGTRRLRSARVSDIRRLMELHSLKKQAAPELQEELTWGRLAKSLR